SFMIDMNVSFYEHQSTYNPNIPLRFAIYFMNAIEDWIRQKKKDLFCQNQIRIPIPYFVVFYNGSEKRPEYEEMKLSDAFHHKTDEPQMELICKVYNINPEHNQGLKRKSIVLDGYTYFVEKVRVNQRKKMNLEEALDDAIEDCINHHILEDFFRTRKDEVKKVTHLDFTWEAREELIRKEEFEGGLSQGLSQGILRGKTESIIELLKDLGEIPEELQTKIMSEKDLEVINYWFKLAAKANSIEEFQEKIQ
ncbi:MAG: hypothetical protein Q4B75_06720, partial [Eubacteriales bacterium]|nr:hypothetical protein [Eubacteriales bacterium]